MLMIYQKTGLLHGAFVILETREIIMLLILDESEMKNSNCSLTGYSTCHRKAGTRVYYAHCMIHVPLVIHGFVDAQTLGCTMYCKFQGNILCQNPHTVSKLYHESDDEDAGDDDLDY